MKCFTIDTNCIIDLEENRADAEHLQELIGIWKENRIELAVVSVSASENQPSGTEMKSYSLFEKKIDAVGLLNAKEFQPVGFWDFGYRDHILWASDEADKELDELKDILFPNSSNDPPEDPTENSRWRNEMCDVLVAWSHRFHKADYLVTRDTNFHKKAAQLANIGVTEIVFPEEALKIARTA